MRTAWRYLPALMMAAALAGPAQAGWLQKLFGFGQDEPQAEAAPAGASTALDAGTIGAGLKQALEIGAGRVVERLGRVDGFNADPQVHIPLPDELAKLRSALDRVGMAGKLDELELELNRAAEAAAPRAGELFVAAIRELTLDDALAIYRGPDDAATRYLRDKMAGPLSAELLPVVEQSLDQVGAARTYETVVGRYNDLPFVPPVQADLDSWVVARGMDGLFFYLAREEAAIRHDPVKRSTELLRKVFSGQ
ncbi:MAG: DUF4197 domain-containing protein [Gammaproteobacteria bacterium]|nr:MAG: DUF4197 domain-containing protein [Gammaproteobacteria bacterium]